MAGSLKAKYGLPLPDMFQVAAALAQPAMQLLQTIETFNVFEKPMSFY